MNTVNLKELIKFKTSRHLDLKHDYGVNKEELIIDTKGTLDKDITKSSRTNIIT